MLDKIAYWHSEILSSGKYKGLPYIVLVGLAKTLGGEVRISDEHDDFVWLTRNKVFDYDLVPETRAALGVLSDNIAK